MHSSTGDTKAARCKCKRGSGARLDSKKAQSDTACSMTQIIKIEM